MIPMAGRLKELRDERDEAYKLISHAIFDFERAAEKAAEVAYAKAYDAAMAHTANDVAIQDLEASYEVALEAYTAELNKLRGKTND